MSPSDPETALFASPIERFRRAWLEPDPQRPGYVWARFVFLRLLGLWFFSAFYSLARQIHGLIGLDGVFPARSYLHLVTNAFPGFKRFWYAPTLLWISQKDGMLTFVVVGGLVASVLLFANVWPRATLALCLVFFLSFVGATDVFSSYQSDGMLLEAGFLSLFFAPKGIWPGLGAAQPPSRASLFMLRWECFRIYFESGLVKVLSGDPQWAHFTAMDHYYENGPLPTWLGWYAQHAPHWVHWLTVLFTFVVELVLCFGFFAPKKIKRALFCVLTPMQIGIILTANYAFLNYLVLSLGFLLVDDEWFAKVFRKRVPEVERRRVPTWRAWTAFGVLAWCLYSTVVEFVLPGVGVLAWPSELIGPFRIANAYGLFAVMTRARYEIEFQGSTDDGKTWTPYPFRYKPQDLYAAPGIYAPYQPRFEWNLWFASLGTWDRNEWVVETQMLLTQGSKPVLSLFAGDPFHGDPPRQVRAVLWQYWFTSAEEKRRTGAWWRREMRGLYAPTVVRNADGTFTFTQERD